MRHALALAVLLGASTASANTTVITIGNDALPTTIAAAQHGAGVIGDDAGTSVLEVDDSDLAAISEQMHHVFHRCGGMIQSPSVEEALHPIQLRSTTVDYTLDHASAVEAVLPELHATTIAQTIRELSAMPNRFYKSAAGAEASSWLAERWRSFATRPGVTVQLVDHGFPQKSVVLTIPGTTRADEVIVIGGHLDSIAMGGISSNAPGADDDASGIATLTEIARALLAADYRPERTIKFIAYEAEEVGLLGSQAIVRDFKRANTNVVGALQLDMTNYQGSAKDIWLMKDYTSAAQNAFLVKLIETYTGATYGLDACGYACSDHDRGRARVCPLRCRSSPGCATATSTSTAAATRSRRATAKRPTRSRSRVSVRRTRSSSAKATSARARCSRRAPSRRSSTSPRRATCGYSRWACSRRPGWPRVVSPSGTSRTAGSSASPGPR